MYSSNRTPKSRDRDFATVLLRSMRVEAGWGRLDISETIQQGALERTHVSTAAAPCGRTPGDKTASARL